MTAIRRELLTKAGAACQEIVPGRLLWVRAEILGQQWDLLNVSQVANAGMDGETKAYRVAERSSIWNKIRRVIRGLPTRSMVALAGDFNLSLDTQLPVTGNGALPGNLGNLREVMELLREARMTVVNTWRKAEPTYLRPTGNTQIDYVAIRQHVADGFCNATSRPAGTLHRGEVVGMCLWRYIYGRFGSLGPAGSNKQPHSLEKPCLRGRRKYSSFATR